MDYKQLLNPKGFAKEKDKDRQRDKVKNGTRSSPQLLNGNSSSPRPSLPKFDPKALLNPKAATARSSKMQSEASSDTMDSDSNHLGLGSMIERFHDVTNREAPLKRKSQEIDVNGEDEMRKKTMAAFNSTSSGGVIGEHLKEQREKGAAQSAQSTEPIDLTNDDDEVAGEEEEVVFMGMNPANDNKEVCLGRLHAKANFFRIPVPPRHQDGVLGGGMWAQMRLNYKRIVSKNNMIDLFDKSGGTIGTKSGNLDYRVASALCPLLDAQHNSGLRMKVLLEPFRRFENEFPGSRTSRVLDVSILLYAPRKKGDMIGRLLSQSGHFLTAPPNLDRGMEYVNPHEPKIFGGPTAVMRKPQGSQATFVVRTQEEMKRDAGNIFDELAQHTGNIPEMEPNASITTPLMSHQKQALHFMVQHELGSQASSEQGATISLWKQDTTHKGGTVWYNIITNHRVDRKPEPERGGILADMMGLGKTLSILSLITCTLDDARQFGATEAPIDAVDVERNVKTTLIICPKSVMSNWEEQIKQHTRQKILKLYSYHGTSRIRDLDELAKFDIILTTYSTAAAEFSDQREGRNTLKGIQWFRIVLDEGHQIRTQSTKVSQACCALSAQRRWVVTGTPVQNRLDDLGSLFRFLRIKPFDDKDSWGRYILAPFRSGNEQILQGFRLLVDSVTLRRQKDKIGLSERRERVIRLGFSDEEQRIYNHFAQRSNLELKYMLGTDDRLRGKSYAHVLRSLGRLRAICAHGKEMLSQDDKKFLEGLDASTAIELGDDEDDYQDESFITEKHAYEAFQMMKDSEVHVCIACGKQLGDDKSDSDDTADSSDSEIDSPDFSDTEGETDVMGYLTPCYHLVCADCKDEHVRKSASQLKDDHYHQCIYCEQYGRFGLFELRRSGLAALIESRNKANQKGKQSKYDESTYSGPHTKVKALLEELKKSADESEALPKDEPPIRSVVFSGWTGYLDLIEHALDQNDINFVRLDGTMSLKARRAVLDAFKNDPAITVLLVSIKAGGQGLNLTAASKVYMMEPQFNPGVELQAIDRVHRLGQERDVDIVRYIMSDSVEEKILVLQEKKMKLARLATEKKLSKGEEARKKIEDLRDLFK